MIEVNLFSVPTGSASMGKCIDRTRYSTTALSGVGVMEFVHGFLKSNVKNFETAVQNSELIEYILSDKSMTTSDLSSINYWLEKAGYVVKIWNVADDEENAVGVSGETAEWNVIDHNFTQEGYPTVVKILPEHGADVVSVLRKVVDQTSLFDENKMPGVKNPLSEYMDSLENVKKSMGKVEPGLAGRVFDTLSKLGIDLFLATSE